MNISVLPILIGIFIQFIVITKPVLHAFVKSESNQIIFYVATDGSDKWSGTLPAPNFANTDGPFATLKKARDTIRELRKHNSGEAFTVQVRGGTYYLNETFVLDTEDSGTKEAPMIYRAYRDERPIICGTKIINNFIHYKDKIIKADLSGIIKGEKTFRQIFIDDIRGILARYPNYNPLDPIGGGFLYVASSTENGSKKRFIYNKGDVKDWTNLKDAELFIFPGDNWGGRKQEVLSIDSEAITLVKDTTNEIKAGNRYFFQNLFEELDSPNEWYFDRQNKILYYFPDDDNNQFTITIPVVESLIEIRGKKYRNKYYGIPSNIRLDGFTFDGCEGSAIVINGAKGVLVTRSIIYNAGDKGIVIKDGYNNLAIGNDIHDTGSTGLYISAGDRKDLIPGNNRADNNHIYNTGIYEKGGASGILCKGVGNIVSHNLIHLMPRVGIWVDGNDNLIEYNHIYDVNRETSDSGIIYIDNVDWTKRGNIIRYNYFHDSGGYGRHSLSEPWQTPYYTHGVYLDNWSSGTLIYGNIIKNCVYGGIFIYGGRDNIIENNILIECGISNRGQMVYKARDPNNPTFQKKLSEMFVKIKEMGYTKYPELETITDIESGATLSYNSFVRNIIYYLNQEALLYKVMDDIDLSTTISDYNIIYHGELPLIVQFLQEGNIQWTAWQSKGVDQHSIIADPKFIDITNNNFTLSSDSPALNLGFKPIPLKNIGPYDDPLRASWPIKEINR